MLGADPLDRATVGYWAHQPLMHRLRGLLMERGRCSWAIGDVLIEALGRPGGGPHDGSWARLCRIADELGCSASWLAATRTTAAAWPERERRPSISWACHRALSARPDRLRLLHDFARDCERQQVVPSLKALTGWLDDVDRQAGRPLQRLGRPRQDPVVAVERLALRLDQHDLERLISRLQAVAVSQRAA